MKETKNRCCSKPKAFVCGSFRWMQQKGGCEMRRTN